MMLDTILNFYETYTYFSMGLAAIVALGLLIGLFSWFEAIMQFLGDLLYVAVVAVPVGILIFIVWWFLG